MKKTLFILLLSMSIALADSLGLSDAVLDWVGKKYGEDARERTTGWRDMLADHGGTEREKLDRVNRFFNRVPYVSDFQNWNKKDYWATPIEVLGVNAADCEDYAIAKYFTLTELGVPSEKLRITYVKAVELQEAHMVLSYYEQEDEIPLILDNLRDEILPATKRKDLVPVYSFNAESIWSAVSRGQGKKLGSSSRIKLWEQLKQKMQEEIKKGA
jgi:predicted transglutaminase-like cysteine proteinase